MTESKGADLSGVPATGCLVNMGFPRFGGGVGGFVRFVAICYPGVMAKDTGRVPRRTTPQRLGRIYEGYLSETAAEVVANASGSETTSRLHALDSLNQTGRHRAR